MKIELDKKFAYDLSGLNENKIDALVNYLNNIIKGRCDVAEYDNSWLELYKFGDYLIFEEERGIWVYNLKGSVEKEVINAEKLFERHKETEKDKPKQYQIGIDTFERAEANLTKDQIIACAKFNIDKYNWRNKEQDIEDFEKIISYAQWAIKNLKNG